mgnify:CR=1 FL=1
MAKNLVPDRCPAYMEGMKRWIPFLKSEKTVAVVRLSGMIAAGGRGLSDEKTGLMLERAFTKGKPSAVALLINSPGGSPVQSSLIAARIRRLSDEKGIPVFAFVEDVAASGGYWLATAADEIYVDQSSVLGSIGVISAGFGLENFIERHGVNRRVYTAGKSKSMLDPFKAEKPEDVERLKDILEQIHEVFIDHVKTRRAGKLNEEQDLFNGEVRIGAMAVEAGLADGIGHLSTVMKERFGEKCRFRNYGVKRGILSRFGAGTADGMIGAIEERVEFTRYGL